MCSWIINVSKFVQTLFHTEIEKNKRLAEMYHQLNCEHLLVKDLFFGFYEKLVNEEAQLKDHNEVRLQDQINIKHLFHDRNKQY